MFIDLARRGLLIAYVVSKVKTIYFKYRVVLKELFSVLTRKK